MDRCDLGLVIPAYNEEATIAKVINEVSLFGIPIVVNDASSDKTAQVAEEAGATVVTHDDNMGYDAALNTGFKKANDLNCKYIITLDADGQHDPKLLSSIIKKFKKNYDLVLCIRHKLPRVSEKIFSIYSNYKFNIHDPCCGLKGYSIELFREKGAFDTYQSIGTELAFFGVKQGYKMTEILFVVNDRLDSPRFGNSIRANLKIFRSLYNAIKRNIS